MARKTPGLNTSSMADISFLLLAFFLMVSDIKTDKGLLRALPPITESKEKAESFERNLFTVLVNKENKIIVRQNGNWSSAIDINTLKDRAKTFLNIQRGDIEDLPQLQDTIFPDFRDLGSCKISKGIIQLKCDPSTTYKKYFEVQDALTAAVIELRNEYSIRRFGHPYNPDPKETSKHKVFVDKAIPLKVSEAKMQYNNVGGNN